MRAEWVAGSAASLALGGVTLMSGFALSPLPQNGEPLADTLLVASQTPERWLASSTLMFMAAAGLTVGAFCLLDLLRRDKRFAVAAVVLYMIGTIGLSGYAMALVFLRGLVLDGSLVMDRLGDVANEPGTRAFLLGWLGSLLLGFTLVAIGLLRNPIVPRWVPVLILAFVVSQFLPLGGGAAFTTVQFMVLAVGLCGAAVAANAHAQAKQAALAVPGSVPDPTRATGFAVTPRGTHLR